MAKSETQKSEKIEFEDIKSKYTDFLKGWSNEYHRFRSYDMVKNYFDKHYDDENKTAEIYEELSIRIFGFLFSWGMRRNNKWLGIASYQVLLPLAEVLFDNKYNFLRNYEPIDHLEKDDKPDQSYLKNYLDTLVELQKKACRALVEGLQFFIKENDEEESKYEKFGKKEKAEEEKKQFSNVSHLMINKILMATYGCVIPYDDYDRKALAALNRKHYSSHWDKQGNFEYDENSRCKKYEETEKNLLKDTYNFIIEQREEFLDARTYLEKLKIKNYTSFKVLDMILWQYGKKTNANEQEAADEIADE